MKETITGWVVLSGDGKIINYFTFSLTRKTSQRKYTRLWKSENWKSLYREGVRCVEAKMTIETLESAQPERKEK